MGCQTVQLDDHAVNCVTSTLRYRVGAAAVAGIGQGKEPRRLRRRRRDAVTVPRRGAHDAAWTSVVEDEGKRSRGSTPSRSATMPSSSTSNATRPVKRRETACWLRSRVAATTDCDTLARASSALTALATRSACNEVMTGRLHAKRAKSTANHIFVIRQVCPITEANFLWEWQLHCQCVIIWK